MAKRPSSPSVLAGILASIVVSACEGEGALSSGEARLRLEPDLVDLGRVYVGRGATAEVQAQSIGAAPIVYEAQFGPGFGEGFVVGPARATIPPQRGQAIAIALDPRQSGLREVEVLFRYGTATATLTVRADVQIPPDCEDGNICTENAFDFELGRCTSRATTDACNDLDACTTRDRCAQAICLGESIGCDDGNVCTDDFCDRETGCVHRLARECDDGNPCTVDFCDPVLGCRSETAADGTPCGQGRTCQVASICIRGSCSEVDVPDGTECDDGDACTDNDQCVSGECLDPDFAYPDDGELEWMAPVGPLAPGAERNPVIDVDGRIFVGVIDGVVAVSRCGAVEWENRTLGTPDADSMLLAPGRLVVPLADRIVELDPHDGQPQVEHDLSPLLEGRTSTAATLQTLDLVVRGSGSLVGSAWVQPPRGSGFGWVYEIPIDAPTPLVQFALASEHAPQLALDRDEALVLQLREGAPLTGVTARERIARLGPDNLPTGSWTASPLETIEAGIAIDAAGRVVWTAGLLTFTRDGAADRLGAAPLDPSLRIAGPAVVDRGRYYFVAVDESAPPSVGESYALIGWDEGAMEPAFSIGLPGGAPGATPALDAGGNVYVVTEDGVLSSWEFDGRPRYVLELGVGPKTMARASVAVTADNSAVIVGDGRVFGVQADPAQSTSAWFRYRRDNFSTGHR